METDWIYLGCAIVEYALAIFLVVRGLLDLEDIKKNYSDPVFEWYCREQINGLKRLAWGNIALGCLFLCLGMFWTLMALF